MKDLPFGGMWVIPTFMGLVRAIVQTLVGTPGTVVVYAAASGSQAGEISYEV